MTITIDNIGIIEKAIPISRRPECYEGLPPTVNLDKLGIIDTNCYGVFIKLEGEFEVEKGTEFYFGNYNFYTMSSKHAVSTTPLAILNDRKSKTSSGYEFRYEKDIELVDNWYKNSIKVIKNKHEREIIKKTGQSYKNSEPKYLLNFIEQIETSAKFRIIGDKSFCKYNKNCHYNHYDEIQILHNGNSFIIISKKVDLNTFSYIIQFSANIQDLNSYANDINYSTIVKNENDFMDILNELYILLKRSYPDIAEDLKHLISKL